MRIKSKKIKDGFTLIELLVVVAIIGILASVVLASLNSARSKGVEAAIKSNLKNMIAQAELSYDVSGNYSGACAAVASMLTAINNAGGTSACYSYDNTRWGASAKNSGGTKNWSVNPNGVVTWDTTDTSSGMTFDSANTACASLGGRLPSLEELKALSLVYGSATPPSFSASIYRSGTADPAISAQAYRVIMNTGGVFSDNKTNLYYVRCVHS